MPFRDPRNRPGTGRCEGVGIGKECELQNLIIKRLEEIMAPRAPSAFLPRNGRFRSSQTKWHKRNPVPSPPAEAIVDRSRAISGTNAGVLDMVLITARCQGPPRLPLALLAVLRPGPRLAAALNGQGKKWRKMETVASTVLVFSGTWR